MTLFKNGDFVLASGKKSSIKIDCDWLSHQDIQTIAILIAKKYKFQKVLGVPSGGIALQNALKPFETSEGLEVLFVDDVFTTGGSLKKFLENHGFSHFKSNNHASVVIFSRNQQHQKLGIDAIWESNFGFDI